MELRRKHSDEFEANETYTVKHIGPKQPNTLQLVNEAGNTSFVPYGDVKVKDIGVRHLEDDDTRPSGDQGPIDSRYLNWP